MLGVVDDSQVILLDIFSKPGDISILSRSLVIFPMGQRSALESRRSVALLVMMRAEMKS